MGCSLFIGILLVISHVLNAQSIFDKNSVKRMMDQVDSYQR